MVVVMVVLLLVVPVVEGQYRRHLYPLWGNGEGKDRRGYRDSLLCS